MTLVARGSLFDTNRVFDHLWSADSATESAQSGLFAPRVDIKELEDHYEITAELPGVGKDNVHVTLEDGVLAISAEIEKEHEEESEGRLIRQERRYGRYMRSFTLGNNVEEGEISARFKDGVLKLSAPKAREEEPQTRRIEIS